MNLTEEHFIRKVPKSLEFSKNYGSFLLAAAGSPPTCVPHSLCKCLNQILRPRLWFCVIPPYNITQAEAANSLCQHVVRQWKWGLPVFCSPFCLVCLHGGSAKVLTSSCRARPDSGRKSWEKVTLYSRRTLFQAYSPISTPTVIESWGPCLNLLPLIEAFLLILPHRMKRPLGPIVQ